MGWLGATKKKRKSTHNLTDSNPIEEEEEEEVKSETKEEDGNISLSILSISSVKIYSLSAFFRLYSEGKQVPDFGKLSKTPPPPPTFGTEPTCQRGHYLNF